MQNNLSKRIAAIIALLAVALAAYWFWSPLLALRQLQAAAKAMDGQAFNERVDYPRLRENVKASLMGQFTANQEKPGDPAGAVGSAFGEMLATKLIDGLVQPEVVMRMMQQGRFNLERGGEQSGTGESDADKKDWIAQREGIDTFIAFVGSQGQAKEQRLGLVMERSGFANWRLVGLRLPQRDQR